MINKRESQKENKKTNVLFFHVPPATYPTKKIWKNKGKGGREEKENDATDLVNT